jgi:DNA-binding transcriptional ArsR family regulator
MGSASLKALAHPLRIEILEVLSVQGPQNSSSLAAILGESSGVTSYHLRQLAKHGFVHEIENKGSSRQRWWERSQGAVGLDTSESSETPASDETVRMVAKEFTQRRTEALMDFLDNAWQLTDGEWKDAGVITTFNLRINRAQLEKLATNVQAQIASLAAELEKDGTQEGSRPVQIHFNAFPLLPNQQPRNT